MFLRASAEHSEAEGRVRWANAQVLQSETNASVGSRQRTVGSIFVKPRRGRVSRPEGGETPPLRVFAITQPLQKATT